MTARLVPLKYVAGINERSLDEATDPDYRFGYVDISTVGHGELAAEPQEMRFADAPSRARRLVQPGDTIVSTVRTYLRAVWPVTDAAANDLVVSTGFAVLTPRAVDHRYFSWWVRSDPFIEEVVARSVGVSYPAINALDLGELAVRCPTPREQRAIADFLDMAISHIDAVAQRKRELARLLVVRWTADLCATLLPGGLDSSTGRPLNSRWVARPLRRLLAKSWGGDWGDEPGLSDAELPCVRAADFDFARLHATTGASRSFTLASVSARGLRPGDLVIEKSGGGEGVPVGRVVAWRGEEQAVPTNFAGGLRPAADVDPQFVLLAFRAAYEVGLPWRSIKQTTGLQNLDLGHYLSQSWPVPPRSEQTAISTDLLGELERVLSIQMKLREQIKLLQEHRQALITGAVTGELAMPGVAA